MKYKMEWKYKVKGMEPVLFESGLVTGEVALKIAEDLEKTGKAADFTFYDEMGADWNLKQLKKLLTEIEEEANEITVYFDGGFQKEQIRLGWVLLSIFNKVRRNIELERMKSLTKWKLIMKQNMRPFTLH